ncbi:hypothetical protein Dsin_008858 [Dipteronia sinensis]|uniref:Uncharacterized protein n=1 Tax=Dipteronia sinensis TaxID=43782 RepID=A0AAE0APH9_9ROSI|nr:hypothetical protein Dsin_008858 [Dipteronia sinensis]
MTLPDGTTGPRAKYKFCPKDYVTSRQGTSHLRRHMEKYMHAHRQIDTTTQAQLQQHPDGSVMTWIYDPDLARNSLAGYIAQTDQPINFENIFKVIIDVLETYGITNRIISITLDNASANASFVALFTERNILQAGSYFFHQRCACHIINLIVQSSMKEVSAYIDRIRSAISWIGSSNPRFREFGRHCTLNGLRPRRFQTDMLVRWNSTYLMLQNCLDYDTTITGFFNMKLAEIGSSQAQAQALTSDDWFGGVDTHPSVESETQPMQTGWSILKRCKKSSSSSSTQRSAASSGAELVKYLDAQFDACKDTD